MKTISVSLFTYVDLGHHTTIEVEIPEGLDEQKEKDFIKNYITENMGKEIDVPGEPDYEKWDGDITYIEAQYDDDDKEGEVIFIENYRKVK